MIKAERISLENQFHLEMGRLQAKYAVGYRDYEILTESGRLGITLYMADNHRSSTWVAIRLLDWPEDIHYPNHWGKFDHWKQNCYLSFTTADQAMKYFRQHLSQFGLIANAIS